MGPQFHRFCVSVALRAVLVLELIRTKLAGFTVLQFHRSVFERYRGGGGLHSASSRWVLAAGWRVGGTECRCLGAIDSHVAGRKW